MDISKLTNIRIGGVDPLDYPTFSDSYVEYAEYKSKPLTDDELEWLADNGGSEICQSLAFEELID